MTLKELLDDVAYPWVRYTAGVLQVFSQDYRLWLLSDYRVSSYVSNQSVILVPFDAPPQITYTDGAGI